MGFQMYRNSAYKKLPAKTGDFSPEFFTKIRWINQFNLCKIDGVLYNRLTT